MSAYGYALPHSGVPSLSELAVGATAPDAAMAMTEAKASDDFRAFMECLLADARPPASH